MDPRLALAVMAGGALGSLLRYGAGLALARGDLAWGTVAVNLLGSFALGFLVFHHALEHGLGPETRLFLTVGLLGGFTTMSAFAVEFAGFAAERHAWQAAATFGLNVFGSLGAAWIGRAAALFASP